jgi:hypothetical protein
VRILLSAGLALLGGSLWLRSEPGAWDYRGIALGLMVMAATILVFGRRVMESATMKANERQMRSAANSSLFGHREVEFGPDGVRSESPLGTMFYKSDAFRKVKATPDLLLLFVGDLQAVIIPRAKLAPGEFEAAEAYAREHYAKAGN